MKYNSLLLFICFLVKPISKSFSIKCEFLISLVFNNIHVKFTIDLVTVSVIGNFNVAKSKDQNGVVGLLKR